MRINRIAVFIFFLLPLAGISQKIYKYTWERYGLEFNTPLVMNEMSDADYWDVDDDEMNMYVGAERYSISDSKLSFDPDKLKETTKILADSAGYDKVRNGGKMEFIKDAYYLKLKDDGLNSYFILIIDRPKKVYYTVLIEDLEDRQIEVDQIFYSLRFNPF